MADEWVTVQLGDVADLLTGFPFKSDQYVYDDKAPRLLRGDNISHGTLRWDGAKRWPTDAAEEMASYSLREGDVILAMDRPWIEAGLKYASVRASDLPSLLVQRVARLRGTDRVDTRFLKYVIGSRAFTEYVLAVQTGTAVPHISGGQIKSFRFPLPTPAEQRAIAHILGTLDDKIELNRRMNATLEAMTQALFKSWFVDFEPVRAKAAGQVALGLNLATSLLFPDRLEDSVFGEIPKGWRVKTINEATALIIDYRGKTPKKLGHGWSESGIPAVSAKNIKKGCLVEKQAMNFVHPELYDLWMKDKLALGDILMTSEAPMGELLYLSRNAQFCLSQRVFGLRANPSECLSTFLYLWLASNQAQERLQSRSTGTTVQGIRQSELRKVEVLLPPLTIQERAHRFFEACISRSANNECENETLASLRDVLLPKLLSGELRVGAAVS
jgi:type I restriction enzyme S subunit